uniref:N-alpha-acetyltransferase 40 n=1 Tax=Moniliophthora roreri TaxID=221103 RepID=A0A0W0G2H8_MONRR
MSATGSEAVRLANQVSASALESNLSVKDVSLNISLASDLSVKSQQMLWDIFEQNMYHLYVDSSFGWSPHEKKAELFHPLSRFVILYPEDNSEAIAGYTMFRFEYEDGFDLLYCYELQIQRSYQMRGLGRLLMEILSCIGEKWQMQKIMLTVFKANKSASQFYQNLGFVIDPDSPEDDEEDYEILSKSISKRA